jgi:hypothetical protein
MAYGSRSRSRSSRSLTSKLSKLSVRGRSRAPKSIAATVNKAVSKAINKNIETKNSCYTNTDGVEVYHNNFVALDTQILKTTQGTDSGQTNDTLNRIGDKINLKYVSIKIFLELNERYSDVTFRLMVIKAAKGDIPTRDNMFNGLSGNKMIDTFNKERFTILKQKWFKIKAPNPGTVGALEGGLIPSGWHNASDGNLKLSRATKIVKFSIPGSKFNRSGVITYQDGTDQPKFFDYFTYLYAYSNYSASQDVYYVARVNDYISEMFYKDA